MKNTVDDVIDYIENYIHDAIDMEAINVFTKEECSETLDYAIKQDDEALLNDVSFYLVFTPYEDLLYKSFDTLISKYPNKGYEINYAINYMSNDIDKAIKMCLETLKNARQGIKKLSSLYILRDINRENKDIFDKYIDLSLVDYDDLEKNVDYYAKLLLENVKK